MDILLYFWSEHHEDLYLLFIVESCGIKSATERFFLVLLINVYIGNESYVTAEERTILDNRKNWIGYNKLKQNDAVNNQWNKKNESLPRERCHLCTRTDYLSIKQRRKTIEF
jgi:hypothetical protein